MISKAFIALYFYFYNYTWLKIQSSLADKSLGDLTWDDIKALLSGLWKILSEAFWKKYNFLSEYIRLHAGFEWLLPVFAILLYFYIRKFFRPPDVKKLESKQNYNGLIRALKYRRRETAVELGMEEDFKENEAVKIRCTAANALGNLGDSRAIPPLLSALTDIDKYVRMNTIRALAKFESERIKDALQMVAKTDPDEFVQYLAKDIIESKGW